MRASRTPCPPTESMRAARLVVGTAHDSPERMERECQRLCPPYKSEPANGEACALSRRARPRVRRDRDARARTIDPTDADSFRGRSRGERIGAQAVVADFVEVI